MEALQLEFYKDSNMQLQSDYYRNLPICNFIQFGVLFINLKKKGKHFAAFRNMLEHFVNYQEYLGRSFSTKEVGKEEIDGFVEYLQFRQWL